MSKDVILDKYARLYEIPNQLALLGHHLNCYCLSYQNHDGGLWDETNAIKQLKWYSKSYKNWRKLQIWSYPLTVLKKLKYDKPDVIIAASDIPHIIIGAWLARKLDVPFVVDLYDNFEAYDQAKIPILKTLFHHALDRAKLIVTTSYCLADKIKREHPNVPNILPMPSVIDKSLFKFGNKFDARKYLKLPVDKKLIGTAGGLTKMKGIDDLLQAWEIIKKESSDICLVLAGPTETLTLLPEDERVIYLGLLAHHDVARLFQALDVGIMCIPNDLFGRFCFPQKAYEMIASNLAIISTEVGDMAHLLEDSPSMLYPPKDHKKLAENVIYHLDQNEVPDVEVLDWTQSVKKLSDYLKTL